MRLHAAYPIALTLFAFGGAPNEAEAAAPASRGVWKKRELVFAQLGFGTTYSCSGLTSKLELLLRASGAREDVQTTPIACGDPGRPNAFAQVRVVFYALVPAPDGSSKGAFRKVALAPRSPPELASGDCELVERFREKVLPLLVTRDTIDRVRCVPHQQAGSTIDLRFHVFAPTPERG